MGNLCCSREHTVQFFVQFFTQLNCTVYLRVYGALYLTQQLIFNNFIVKHFIIPLLGIITEL